MYNTYINYRNGANKMKTLTEAKALEVGGKIWEKEGVKRIYLNIDSVSALIVSEGYKALDSVSKKMRQAKTFLDLNTNELKSDVGMVRSALCSSGFNCEK